jgi:hypothetical protein
MDKIKKLLPFLLLIVLASITIVLLFPLAHPYGGFRLSLNAQSVERRSRAILAEMGISTEGLSPQTQLKYDQSLFREVEQRNGIEKANDVVRSKVAVYHWDITWRRTSALQLAMKQGNSQAQQADRIAQIIRGDVFLQLSTDGRLLEFEQKVPDSVSLPSVAQPEARAFATSFLHHYADAGASVADTAQSSSEKRIEQKNRVDYEFTWNTRTAELDNPMSVKISVAGSSVVHYQATITVPEEYKKTDMEAAFQVALPIVYFIVIMIMVVVAFRRFRSFELGFRLAIIVGIVAGVILGIQLYLTMRTDAGWEILIPLVLGPLFYGGGLVIVWAVSESAARESWKEKLISLDLLSKGYAFHSRVGENIVRGVALGLVGFAFSLLLTFAANKVTHTWATQIDEPVTESFGAFIPWLYVLANGITTNAYKISIIVLFVVSFLQRRISSPLLLIPLASLIMALVTQGHLAPVWMNIIIETIIAGVTIWGFYRYDALTAFLCLFTFTVMEEIGSFLVAGNSSYTQSGLILAGILILLVIVGLVAQTRKREITEFDDITPAFAKHITERQRLQQELEIARSVQMSFLPKSNPSMAELDIASRCAPALEVGGDYYDFIDLHDKRLGVVVGDVSGKGTQAAFFMTLTKGFVHALAGVSNSPSAVLTQVNKLFYESVDRGVFISMVYGVFDTQQHVLTLARAGHNPVIMRKTMANQVQIVNPMGLALGLDAGETFGKSIQEVSIPFQSGDLFVFYTDGFPEAMNKTLEEFGEDRLCGTVQRYAHGTAAEIMDGVFADMRQFVGKAKQHDDMTIVVVKVV